MQQPGLIRKQRETERALASAIFVALRRANPRAFIQGDPQDSVLVDGDFIFPVLARFVRQELEKLDAGR